MMGLGVVGFLLLAVPHQIVVSIAVPIAFATGWAWLGSYNLAIAKLNPEAPGAAMGVVQAGAFMGSIVGPISWGFWPRTTRMRRRGSARRSRRSWRPLSSSCCAEVAVAPVADANQADTDRVP